MNRITGVIAMYTRDRVTWIVLPWSILGAAFVICLALAAFLGDATPFYTGAVSSFYFVMLATGISAVVRAFSFAIGLSVRRRDFILGALAMGIVVSAAWALLLGLLSLIEANVFKNWGTGLHFFHLPFLSDGTPLRQFCWSYYHDAACAQSDPTYLRGGASLQQFWVYFALLLFLYLLGLLIGSVYQRFGRTGAYVLGAAAFLLLSAFLLLASHWNWWSTIFDWLARQTATALAFWLLPLIALCALASYALLRKATV